MRRAKRAGENFAIWTSPQRQNPYEIEPGAQSAPGKNLRFEHLRKGKIPMKMNPAREARWGRFGDLDFSARANPYEIEPGA